VEIEIVQADVAHVAEIARLGRTTFVETYKRRGQNRTDEMVSEYVAEKFSDETLKRELSDPEVAYFLGQVDGAFVGYAKVIVQPPPKFVHHCHAMCLDCL
jgi:hypothetical protein